MCLTNEHVGPNILAKIKIYTHTRAELLITLCNEIPCNTVGVDAIPNAGVNSILAAGAGVEVEAL